MKHGVKYTQAELDHAVADAVDAELEQLAQQAERLKLGAEKNGLLPVALAYHGMAELARSRMRASQ